ncbi:MAG: translocation/assembly module TamB domain-containing protein, partial [Spirochaetales bacterium]
WVVKFDTQVEIFDTTYQFQALLDPSGYLRITRDPQIELELHWDTRVGAFGSVSLQNFPLSLLRLPNIPEVDVSGKMEFFYESLERWALELEDVKITGLPILTDRIKAIHVRGTLTPSLGTFTYLKLVEKMGPLEGYGSLSYRLDENNYKLTTYLKGEGPKPEQYFLTLQYEAGDFSFEGELSEASLSRFITQEGVYGRITGKIQGKNILTSRSFQGDLQISEGGYRGVPFSLGFTGIIAETKIEAYTLKLTYGEGLELSGRVTLDLKQGSLQWDANAKATFADKPVAGKIQGKVIFEGEKSLLNLPDLYLYLRSGASTVTFEQPSLPQEYRQWSIQIAREGTEFLFSGGPLQSIEGRVRTEGTFSLRVKAPLWITFESEGSFDSQGKLRASIQNLQFSLSSLREQLDFGIFRITEGKVTGELTLEGPLQDPYIFGELRVRESRARLDIVEEELGPFLGILRFNEKTFTLEPVTLQTRGGSVQVGGTFELEKYSLNTAFVWIDTERTGRTGGVRIKGNFNGVLLEGIGRGKVEISVKDEEVQVTGKVLASNTKITLGEIQWDNGSSAPKDTRFLLDLEIISDRLVEFVWPSETFPIVRSFAALGQKLNIQMDSQTDFSLVKGDITIRGGQIYYFDRVFYLREGKIIFNERGDRFDPIISARAEIRENTQTGIVRIYLIADNTRFSQFSPRFESEPSLSQLEIFAILGGPSLLTSVTQEAVNLSSALLLSTDLFLQSEVIRSFERDMRNRFNLDLFSVRTQIFQNVLSEMLIPQDSIPVNQALPSLGRYLDKSSIFIGKYIGTDLFVEYLLQLRAQDPFTDNIRPFGGLSLESEIIFEWKTPFFLLAWSFQPKTPEELFIRDNTLSLRWRFSF